MSIFSNPYTMKLKQCLLLVFLAVGLCTNVACKKDSKSDAAKTKTQLLTQKEWVQIAGRSNTDNGVWTDDWATAQACDKDDRVVFSSNGTYNFNEGSSKCSASDPQIYSQGTWILTTNDTKISIFPAGKSQSDMGILQLDESTLKFLQVTVASGRTYNAESTFSHP